MTMHLYSNWRTILRRAWSIRFIALAAGLSGLEAVAMVVGIDWLPLPAEWRMVVLFGVIAAAFVARLVAQRDV